MHAQRDLANFVLAEHKHTELSDCLQPSQGLDGVVVQVEKYEIGQVSNIGNGLDVVVLIIQQPQTFFTLEHGARRKLPIVDAQALRIGALVLAAPGGCDDEQRAKNDSS